MTASDPLLLWLREDPSSEIRDWLREWALLLLCFLPWMEFLLESKAEFRVIMLSSSSDFLPLDGDLEAM